MSESFYNFQHFFARAGWERGAFLRQWWGLARSDPRWVPPDYYQFRRELDPRRNSHLRRSDPLFVTNQAMVRQARMSPGIMPGLATPNAVFLNGPLGEVTLCATVVLQNSARQDHAACLALLQCANTPEGLERLLMEIAVDLAEQGITQVVAPTGLSAFLGTGALQDSWDRLPPLHTPYHPPYFSELLGSLMDPFAEARLYHLPVAEEEPSQVQRKAPFGEGPFGETLTAGLPGLHFLALHPRRWTEEIPFSLFQAACPAWGGFRPPDEAEIGYLKRQAARGPVLGWLAQVEGQTTGFILLQPDFSTAMQRASGGRGMIGPVLLEIAKRRPARAGRILFGGVLPGWRRRGIGSGLLAHAVSTSRRQGWRTLIVGPLPVEWHNGAFLEKHGAQAGQTYRLYRRDLL